ncbi:MAG: hypothetical protein AB7G93_15330 [Bdellovibrionales bacterium]
MAAYASSLSEDKGIYVVDTDGKSRLVSYGPNDLHPNVSRDGKLIVTDTQNGFNQYENTLAKTDIVLINASTGERVVLYTAMMAKVHPYHAHPHFSPDGKWIIFNDAEQQRVVALSLDSAKLNAFLSQARAKFTAPWGINSGTSAYSNGVVLSLLENGKLIARNQSTGERLWELATGSNLDCRDKGCHLSLQSDGNLVLYQGSTPLWYSQTNKGGFPGKFLQLSTLEPYVKVLSANGSILWASTNNYKSLSLKQGQFVRVGTAIDGRYLVMQGDGNLVMYNGESFSASNAVWDTKTYGGSCLAGCHAEFQPSDGNFVLYDGAQIVGNAYWSSNTSRIGDVLMLQMEPPYVRVRLK